MKILCDLISDKLLSQMVTEDTTIDNVLNLVFVNNKQMINDVDVLVNSGLSDHNLCVVRTNIMAQDSHGDEEVYPYTTSILKYRLLEATEPVWKDLNNFCWEVDWEAMLEDRPAELMTDLLVDKIEEAVVSRCGSLSKANKTTKDSCGHVWQCHV